MLFVISLIGATPLMKNLVMKLKEKTVARSIVNLLTPFTYVLLILVVTAFLIDGSFSPFIYFSF